MVRTLISCIKNENSTFSSGSWQKNRLKNRLKKVKNRVKNSKKQIYKHINYSTLQQFDYFTNQV